jgi:hypothetical protein
MGDLVNLRRRTRLLLSQSHPLPGTVIASDQTDFWIVGPTACWSALSYCPAEFQRRLLYAFGADKEVHSLEKRHLVVVLATPL